MVLAGGFEAQILVDDAPLKERRAADGKVYVISPFDAAATFQKKLLLVCPAGYPYEEEWAHTPFKVRVTKHTKLQDLSTKRFWVYIYIDGELAHKKVLHENTTSYTAKGFCLDMTETEEFCFTPPRTISDGNHRTNMTSEQREKIGTIEVAFHETQLVRTGGPQMSGGANKFAEVNKADAKAAAKNCMVASGRILNASQYHGVVDYYNAATEQNRVARAEFNYVSQWQAGSIFPELAPATGYSGSDQVEFDADALARDVQDTFQLPDSCLDNLRAGLNACDKSVMTLVPTVRRPVSAMPSDPVGLRTEEGRRMLQEQGGEMVGGTAQLEQAWRCNVKEFSCNQGESLCFALAHQMTMTEHAAPMVCAVVSAALGRDAFDSGDADVLNEFAAAFKCYVMVNVVGSNDKPLLVKPANSVFGAACYRLGVRPSAEGEGRGEWFSLTNSSQSKEESKARRAQKRKRMAENTDGNQLLDV